MLNVPNWLSSRLSAPNGRSGGKQITLSACLAMILLAGCMTVGGPSTYRPQIPVRPTLEAPPVKVECDFAPAKDDGDKPTRIAAAPTQSCVYLLTSDLAGLIDWALTLDTELRAACLALGGTERECGTSASP